LPSAKPPLDRNSSAYRPIYDEVAARLQAEPWFADGWIVTVGSHETLSFLGLNKEAWRVAGMEIHVESWIRKDQIAKRQVPVAMHVEGGHYVRRNVFNAQFPSGIAELVQGWEGYTVSETGMTRLTVSVPLVTDTLAEVLATEFARMARVGPVVDRIVETMR
jgi:hypothetical protein